LKEAHKKMILKDYRAIVRYIARAGEKVIALAFMWVSIKG
jgi:hypothetical protein